MGKNLLVAGRSRSNRYSFSTSPRAISAASVGRCFPLAVLCSRPFLGRFLRLCLVFGGSLCLRSSSLVFVGAVVLFSCCIFRMRTFLGKNPLVGKTHGWLALFTVGRCFGKTHTSVGKTFRKNPFHIRENLLFELGCFSAFSQPFISCLWSWWSFPRRVLGKTYFRKTLCFLSGA